MIVELTLLSTFIFYHLLLGLFIGGSLLRAALAMANKASAAVCL
jgi:hypothetical protein